MPMPWCLPLLLTAACLAVVLGVSGEAFAADWRDEANARIEQLRKGDLAVRLVTHEGIPLAGASVAVQQTRSHFHFGVAVTGNPLSEAPDERRYFKFITDHFSGIVCENAMKWYATEKLSGQIDNEPADLLLRWAEINGLAVRGHCLFWAKPKFTQAWIQELPVDQLRQRVEQRLVDSAGRYKGRLVCWDVNNEMLDGTFYLDRLGPEIRAHMFKRAHELDPAAALFVNEYGIIGSPAKTARYVQLIRDLAAQGAPVGGIGVQEHACERFSRRLPANHVNPAEDEGMVERKDRTHLAAQDIYSSLDELAKLGLPIHLTEVSCKTPDVDARADGLEVLYRTAFSHPRVDAILLWGFWARRHWLGADASLVDKDWNLNAAGQRLEQMLLREWRTNLDAAADGEGVLAFRGFYGTYRLSVTDAQGKVTHVNVTLGPDAASKTTTVTVGSAPAKAK